MDFLPVCSHTAPPQCPLPDTLGDQCSLKTSIIASEMELKARQLPMVCAIFLPDKSHFAVNPKEISAEVNHHQITHFDDSLQEGVNGWSIGKSQKSFRSFLNTSSDQSSIRGSAN